MSTRGRAVNIGLWFVTLVSYDVALIQGHIIPALIIAGAPIWLAAFDPWIQDRSKTRRLP